MSGRTWGEDSLFTEGRTGLASTPDQLNIGVKFLKKRLVLNSTLLLRVCSCGSWRSINIEPGRKEERMKECLEKGEERLRKSISDCQYLYDGERPAIYYNKSHIGEYI